MKKALITLTLASMLAMPAYADPKGCNGYGVGTFFDNDDNGNNCPPSKWEKAVGDVLNAGLFVLVVGGVLHKTGKVKIFPLGG